jgi:hypothetical protein
MKMTEMVWKYRTEMTIVALIFTEIILCLGIIYKIPCMSSCLSVFSCSFLLRIYVDTEIDWIAYMQEVEGYLNGERNYSNLKGDTGPLVYPAGFVYVFSVLRWMTDDGTNISQGRKRYPSTFFLFILSVFYSLRTIHFWCGLYVCPGFGSSAVLQRESNPLLCISSFDSFQKNPFHLCPSSL